MADENAASSTAVAEVADPFKGENLSLAEYSRYRTADELPARFKPAEPAESAPADAQEETEESGDEESESASASETEETQEQPKPGSAAEKRIKQLLARTKELERKLAEPAKPTQQTDSSTARPQQPQNFSEWQKAFKPAEWIADFAKANPNASYEDANFAMAVRVSEVKDHFRSVEQQATAQKQRLGQIQEEARERYEDFDTIKESFLSKVLNGTTPLIPPSVLGIINDSDIMADLLYTIGSDEQEMEKFVAMAKANPNKAIRYVARVENLITEELAKGKESKETPVRGGDGKFTKTAPEPKKTSAPKPVSPVGGSSRGNFDVSDESLSPDEWMRKRTADLDRRRKS